MDISFHPQVRLYDFLQDLIRDHEPEKNGGMYRLPSLVKHMCMPADDQAKQNQSLTSETW